MDQTRSDDGAPVNESCLRTEEEIVRRLREHGAEQASPPATDGAADLPVIGEKALRELESSSSPMRIFDLATLRFLAVNDAAVALYGYTREEFLGMSVMELRHPEELEVMKANLAEQLAYLRHRPARRHLTKSGEVRVVELVTQDVLFRGRRARLSLTIDITGRLRMQELIWRRQQEFETLAEHSPDIVSRLDREYRHLYVNSAVTAATGRPPQAFVGKTVSGVGMPPELVARWHAVLGQAFASGEEQRLESVVMGPSGERHYECRIIPERGPSGSIETVLVLTRDFTDQKKAENERERAEHALRESNEFLHSVIESSRDCIKVLDLEGRLLSISAGGQRLMEIEDPSAFLGKQYLDFFGGEDRIAAEKVLRISRGGDTGRFEGYCPTIRGIPKWWDEVVSPILDKHGRPQKLLVVSRDITDHKNAEIALRGSEEKFRQLAENIRQVFWITTLSLDKMVYVSPAYEEIWGRSRESLYAEPRSWIEAVHTEDRHRVEAAARGLAEGRMLDVEYRVVRPDGTLRWIRDRSYLMKTGGGAPLACGIAEDITDLKEAEQERLVHAIHQRDALVREIHHRIKNSLQGVVGLLRQKIRKYPAVARDMEEAIGQLQSVALVYGLQETRPDGMLSLAEITDAICSSAEKLIGGRVGRNFERVSREHACIAGAEAVSVAVALNELVFNALKHQPAQAGRKRATLTLSEAQGTAEICISNRGHLPKGFDFAVGRAVGYGLGLVRTLLSPPGGTITFNGRRERVEVRLTLAPPLLARQRKARARPG